ncbi:MAG: hypothetical protein WC417_02725 [Candidatus Omnitrophota bacterium]|jgi:hypothetical protein
MKNTNNNKKCRKETITTTTIQNTTSISIDYDPSSNGFIFNEADPSCTKHNISYDRASGKEKILSIIPTHNKSASIDHLQALKNSVDYLCAIDTNSRVINDTKVSISVIAQVPGILREHKNAVPFYCLCAYLITDITNNINPETIGWHLFLSRKIIADHFINGRRLGLVVDSELDKLDSINSKAYPYYENYFLPNYVSLIYASTDSGNEHIANRLIAFCDSCAKRIFEHIENNQIEIPKLNNGDKNFSGFRAIKFKS